LTFCTGCKVGQIVGVGIPGGVVGVGVGDDNGVGVGVGTQLLTAVYVAVRESVPLCPFVHERAKVSVPACSEVSPVFIILVLVAPP